VTGVSFLPSFDLGALPPPGSSRVLAANLLRRELDGELPRLSERNAVLAGPPQSHFRTLAPDAIAVYPRAALSSLVEVESSHAVDAVQALRCRPDLHVIFDQQSFRRRLDLVSFDTHLFLPFRPLTRPLGAGSFWEMVREIGMRKIAKALISKDLGGENGRDQDLLTSIGDFCPACRNT
jgi:hypothetical protein